MKTSLKESTKQPYNNDIEVACLLCVHVTRYDLCIKVATSENQDELFHQAFCQMAKLREADQQSIILCGWHLQKKTTTCSSKIQPISWLLLLKQFVFYLHHQRGLSHTGPLGNGGQTKKRSCKPLGGSSSPPNKESRW